MTNPAPRSNPARSGWSKGHPAIEAFSILELLVVVAIIAILAGLVLQTAGFVQNKAARSLAQAQVAALSNALESYRIDNGQYPTGTNTSKTGNNAFLYTALTPPTGRVYYEFDSNMLAISGGQTNVLDPFGERFAYQFPGDPDRSGTNFFDLWSFAGAPAAAGNEERWEKNW